MKRFSQLLARTKIRSLSLPVKTLALAGLLIAIAAASGAVFAPRQLIAVQAQAATPPAAASNPDESMAQGLRQALNNSNLSDSDHQALQKKLAYQEQLAAQRDAAPAGHGPKGALGAPVPMPRPLPQALLPEPSEPVERILEGSEGAIHTWEASVTNMWEGAYQGIPTQVFAGSAPDNSAQGLVIVLQYPPNEERPVRHSYPAPASSGGLRILDRQGDRLRCSSADGSILFFNLATQTLEP